MTGPFSPTTLDDSPRLLEDAHRLRYQVYCLERGFLRAEDYPDHLEIDEFDRVAVHVGVLDVQGGLVATARVVPPSSLGLPLLAHCQLDGYAPILGAEGNMVVELSRACISRRYSRRREDVFFEPRDESGSDQPATPLHERRTGRDDIFTPLLKAMYQASKRMGATHWVIAVEHAFRRRLAHYGTPFQVAGPEVDYWGLVTPHIMSIAELDQVILGRRFKLLDEFLEGLEPALWPQLDGQDTAAPHVGG